ncbi:hypothetical protein DOY81_006531, partial [Sarcophaga bullata]
FDISDLNEMLTPLKDACLARGKSAEPHSGHLLAHFSPTRRIW